MKKIRYNCFETNSSSVHSLTIKHRQDKKIDKLLIHNVLYPGVLLSKKIMASDTELEHEGMYSKSTILAETKDEKAALLFLFLNYELFEGWDVDKKEETRQYIMYVKEKLGYDNVILSEEDVLPTFKDRGDLEINVTNFNFTIINEFIEVILDDYKIIEDIQGEN